MKALSKIKNTSANKIPRLTKYRKPSRQWADNWLEQVYEAGNKTEASSLVNIDMNEFHFY